MNWVYPAGSVANLITSEHVSPPTRAALEARMAAAPAAPRWFDAAEFALLEAVCARLIVNAPGIDIAGAIDARLAGGNGDGWRYDDLPPDGEAFRQGLRTIDNAAGGAFVARPAEAQDAVLRAVQQASPLWFEELLAEATETAYAHPVLQAAIGYAGFADLPGWTAIGLDEREAREPMHE